MDELDLIFNGQVRRIAEQLERSVTRCRRQARREQLLGNQEIVDTPASDLMPIRRFHAAGRCRGPEWLERHQ